ncbi:MAG: 6,7-dimethyl-8-ribityllumazine synthase, partial [Parabacteroides sp.]|nr:6,7-dimethyl-8-ribityllumazine synthase [Parabacteroides sp.]
MATAYQNLSEYDFNSVPNGAGKKFGIVVAEWNKNITEKLLEGACNTLERHGVKAEDIYVKRVPGSFELT